MEGSGYLLPAVVELSASSLPLLSAPLHSCPTCLPWLRLVATCPQPSNALFLIATAPSARPCVLLLFFFWLRLSPPHLPQRGLPLTNGLIVVIGDTVPPFGRLVPACGSHSCLDCTSSGAGCPGAPTTSPISHERGLMRKGKSGNGDSGSLHWKRWKEWEEDQEKNRSVGEHGQ